MYIAHVLAAGRSECDCGQRKVADLTDSAIGGVRISHPSYTEHFSVSIDIYVILEQQANRPVMGDCNIFLISRAF